MRIRLDSLLWDDATIDKLWRKHRVEWWEVEERSSTMKRPGFGGTRTGATAAACSSEDGPAADDGSSWFFIRSRPKAGCGVVEPPGRRSRSERS